ncbi:MAG: phenylacetate-CoA oxygenase/reductase subunit PaaK [Bacteroidetes bacterium]|nr:MAG: phenylacetate-CoA oxygenase/reductase subunit PaaK [Bacteroidota bacterium]
MTRFYPLPVREIRSETADCISLVLDVPEEWKNVFQFTQGQYLTFRVHLGGEELRRSYSICSSPLDAELRVAVKLVPGGVFSTFAHTSLHEGDVLETLPPAGRFFTPLDPAHKKRYVAFAAGSGITPILSLIKTTLRTEPQSEFTLVYGNRSRASVIFKEEIESLKNRYMGRLAIHHVLSRELPDAPILGGRIDAGKCRAFFERLISVKGVDEWFICGPEEMMLEVRAELEAAGVERKHIHIELFAAASPRAGKAASESGKQPSGKVSQISVRLDGVSFQMEVAQEGEALLDVALRHGADLPYACKGGVCCTCRARLIEGEVVMDVNYGLEPDEIAAGFILTCQAHPRSEKVVVDFD